MSGNTFAVGNLVRLKAGGPVMTVNAVPGTHTKYYICQWFAGKKLDRGHFQAEELEAATLPAAVPVPPAAADE